MTSIVQGFRAGGRGLMRGTHIFTFFSVKAHYHKRQTWFFGCLSGCLYSGSLSYASFLRVAYLVSSFHIPVHIFWQGKLHNCYTLCRILFPTPWALCLTGIWLTFSLAYILEIQLFACFRGIISRLVLLTLSGVMKYQQSVSVWPISIYFIS